MTGIEAARIAATDGAQVFRPRKGFIPQPGEAPQYDVKPFFSGNKRGWVALDSFSASAIVAVYNALNETNQAKFNSASIQKMAGIAFKLVEVGKGARNGS